MTTKAKSSTASPTKVGPATDCARGSAAKPTFTRPSSVQPNYVASKSAKTNSGVLHQPRTLNAPPVDKARDRSETGGGRGASRKLTGNLVEMSRVAAQAATPVTGVRSRDAEIAVRKASIVTQRRVFVLGKSKHSLMPCHPARARALLKAGQAVIHRKYPTVIRLKTRTTGATQPVAFKLDPGAKTTGIALVRIHHLNPKIQSVLFTCELTHRGFAIRDSITQRASFRGSRRGRKTRYRAPRFLNRGGDKTGWLPPSLRHRLETILSWVARYRRWLPVTHIIVESVCFDMQLMQNPEISGVEYQQGELADVELREYLLEKWGRKCAYCDKDHVPLNLDHVVPKSRGGPRRASNFTLSCVPCNQAEGNQSIEAFLAKDPQRLAKILRHAKAPLAAAAAVNATRNAVVRALAATGLPVETGTGGRTKWNRTRFSLPKSHALDAACVGQVDGLFGADMAPLSIRCMGRGPHQRTRLTADGFPRGYLTRQKDHFGFRTGDIVRAIVPSGKRKGTHSGRVAVRATGNFNVQTKTGVVQGIAHRHCEIAQCADDYAYAG